MGVRELWWRVDPSFEEEVRRRFLALHERAASFYAALGRAQIAPGKAEIGIDHTDQRQAREVVTLRDNLGADNNVVFMIADIDEDLAQLARVAEPQAENPFGPSAATGPWKETDIAAASTTTTVTTLLRLPTRLMAYPLRDPV